MACGGGCGGRQPVRAPQTPSGVVTGYITVQGGELTGQYASWPEAQRSGNGTPMVVNLIDGLPAPGALRALKVVN